jgi:hypothetical protein
MDESSLSGFTTENSMSMSIKEPSINTCTCFEKYLPICLSKDLKKHIIKSIAQNLKGIIKENIQNNQMKFVIKSDIFYLNHFPPISIEDYINRIYKGTKMNISTLILSIIYIDRFCETNGYILSLNNVHRILLAACLLSLKFNEDVNIDAQYYANIAGVPINDLNNLECYLYVKLKFSLFVEHDFYQKYFEYFSKSIN